MFQHPYHSTNSGHITTSICTTVHHVKQAFLNLVVIEGGLFHAGIIVSITMILELVFLSVALSIVEFGPIVLGGAIPNVYTTTIGTEGVQALREHAPTPDRKAKCLWVRWQVSSCHDQ